MLTKYSFTQQLRSCRQIYRKEKQKSVHTNLLIDFGLWNCRVENIFWCSKLFTLNISQVCQVEIGTQCRIEYLLYHVILALKCVELYINRLAFIWKSYSIKTNIRNSHVVHWVKAVAVPLGGGGGGAAVSLKGHWKEEFTSMCLSKLQTTVSVYWNISASQHSDWTHEISSLCISVAVQAVFKQLQIVLFFYFSYHSKSLFVFITFHCFCF